MNSACGQGNFPIHMQRQVDYTLTGIPNDNEKRLSWWLTKRGIGRSVYCFSADENDIFELGYQVKNWHSYVPLLESICEER